MPFQLESNYKPRGDQGQAIAKLLKSVEAGNRHQTLLGVTGSGKTFTIANVIRDLDRPTLVISHNKTLAAQLTPSSNSSSRATPSNISSATSITISRKLTSRAPTPTSRKTHQLTKRLNVCGCPRPVRCFRAVTPSLLQASRASMA